MVTDSALPLPVAGIFGVIGIVLVALALRELWVASRYRSLRPTPVAELPNVSGRVTVHGRARRADRTLTAPLTGAPRLAYAWRASDLRTVRSLDGSVDTRRSNVGSGRDAVPFVVEDDTGSVLVDPEGAELRLAESYVPDPASDPAGRPDVLTGLDPFGEARAREYHESRLDEGEAVTVRGRVSEDTLSARALGIRITGGDTLIEDATPGAAARRALKRAAYSGLSGLFVLVVLAFLLGLVP